MRDVPRKLPAAVPSSYLEVTLYILTVVHRDRDK